MTTQNTDLAPRASTGLAEAVGEEMVTVAPPVDIYENKDEILVVADLPAVPSDAVSVRLEGAELTIEGIQARSVEQPNQPTRRYARAFRVPNTVDPDGITAELDRGVLRLHLAKSEAAKPKRIEVRTA